MNIFSAALLSVSDIIIYLINLTFLSAIYNKKPDPLKVGASAAVIILLCIFTELFYAVQLPLLQFVLLFINGIKCCLLALWTFSDKSAKDALILFIIQFICSLIYSIFVALFSLPPAYMNSMILPAIRIFALIMFTALYRKLRHSETGTVLNIIPTHVYALVLLSVFIENGLIAMLTYDTSKSEIKFQLIRIIIILLVISVLVIILSLIFNVIYKSYYGTVTKILEQQVNAQIDHYTKMEKMNSEIRKFKHDYKNHISCISGMLKAQKYAEAEEYIQAISGCAPSGEFIFKTGNYIADAILSDKQEQAAAYSVRIEFDGFISPDINNTDLCIILSNTLDNAIEACRKAEGEKNVSIQGSSRQGYIVLVIKNPVSEQVEVGSEIPATTKPDKANHGLGLLNVESVVSRYDGKMDISCKDGIFTVSMALNIAAGKKRTLIF